MPADPRDDVGRICANEVCTRAVLVGYAFCPGCLARIDAAIDRAVEDIHRTEVDYTPLTDEDDTRPGLVHIPTPKRVRVREGLRTPLAVFIDQNE